MELLVHDKPCQHKKICEYFHKGFVLGTSFEHYRAWIMWRKASHTTRVSATAFHKHKYISNLSVSATNTIMVAASNLEESLKGKMTQHHHILSLNELKHLGNIFLKPLHKKPLLLPPTCVPLATKPRYHSPILHSSPNVPHV